MKERLISIVCGLCLVLCFALIVSWARSTVSAEGFNAQNRFSSVTIATSEGSFFIFRGKLVFDSPQIEQAWRSVIDPQRNRDPQRWRTSWSRDMGVLAGPESFLGFGLDSTVSDTNRRVLMPGVRWHRTRVQIPHWALLVAIGVAPGCWLYRRSRFRQSRIAQGQCRRCGFEMGNVYHSCPKCGERAPLPEGFPVIE